MKGIEAQMVKHPTPSQSTDALTGEDAVSLGSLHLVAYPPWVTTSRFLVGNREGELKPTTFSSLILFHVFL